MKYLLCLFLILLIKPIHAQVHYSAGLGVGYMKPGSNLSDKDYVGKSYQALPDSLVEVSVVNRRSSYEYRYYPQIKVSAFGHVDFSLTKSLELNTGLEVSFFHFNVEHSFSSKIVSKEIIDTVSQNSSPGGSYIPYCDSTVYIIIGNQKSNEYGLVELHIPIALKYELFDGFKINVGARLSTPVLPTHVRYKMEQDLRVEDGKLLCIQTNKEIKDHSGLGFNQMRISLQGGAHYRISERIELDLLVTKSLNHLYSYDDSDGFKPLGIRLGASYIFGKILDE